MRSIILASVTVCSLGLILGCSTSYTNGRIARYAPDTGHHDLWDAVFRRRHQDLKHTVNGDSMLELAREVTILEDDIRRDGSITIKTPDVWGDGNLIASIQEYDKLMGFGDKFETRFSETVQGYIARSDYAEFQSTTAIGQALSGAPLTNVTETVTTYPGEPAKDNTQTKSDNSPNFSYAKDNKLPESRLPSTPDGFGLIKSSTTAVPSTKGGIGLEPTELDRQRSTFILANQALRRRMIGDDNSRAAGYGLYLFRIPVSVLPGRETTEGYSAVVNVRAQLRVDANHLKNTFPRMVIADLVEGLNHRILGNWEDAKVKRSKIAKLSAQKRVSGELGYSSYQQKLSSLDHESSTQTDSIRNFTERAVIPNSARTSSPSSALYNSHSSIFGDEAIDGLVDQAISQFETEPAAFVLNPPKPAEVNQFLYAALEQTHNILLENHVYEEQVSVIATAAEHFTKGRFDLVAEQRDIWRANISNLNLDPIYHNSSWLLALQSGIADRNLKKILSDLQSSGYSEGPCAVAESVQFFIPDSTAVALWETVVRETFPLHVFNLDPVTEEQNAYDAFARRREMQVALAFGVAKGSAFTADQKAKMSRSLALDEATIALNRTAVAFAHSDDTFGWYFHPRIQTPPTESSNIAALARTLWATGPTDCYDRRHRRIEPGMRNCEVLIAMPSFVTDVAFDVTTNWEKVACPGVTKRSYEEMIAQGSRLHRLRMCMKEPSNQICYRPGDLERLNSRIDQLETMLGMQTHQVNLPFQYEQSASGLFDAGRKQLRPVVDYYYGLSYLDKDQKNAEFFLTGKNFHPTLTHVIVGGSENHSQPDSSVEIINRELLKVQINGLEDKLSKPNFFEVRVSTPAGMSNLLVIEKAPKPAERLAPAAYDWKSETNYTGYLCRQKPNSTPTLHINELETTLKIKSSLEPDVADSGNLNFTAKIKFKSGTERDLKNFGSIAMKGFAIKSEDFVNALNVSIAHPQHGILLTDEPEGVITCHAYLMDTTPVILPTPISIAFSKVTFPSTKCSDEATPGEEVVTPDAANEPLPFQKQAPAPEPKSSSFYPSLRTRSQALRVQPVNDAMLSTLR